MGYWDPVGGGFISLVSFSALCSGFETRCWIVVADGGEMGISGPMILRHFSDLMVSEDFKWDSFCFVGWDVTELFSLLDMLNLFFSSCSTELVFLFDIITFGVNFAGEFV